MYATFESTPRQPLWGRFMWTAVTVLCTLAAVATTVAAIAVMTSPPAHATEFACPHERSTGVVTGSGPGDTTSGPAAILGFNHAYYVDRSAEQARRFLTADSVIATGDRLQTGIDAAPADTRHCVSISPLTTGGESARWSVTVAEFRPSTEPWIARQTVTTRTVDEVTLISEITLA
ncbi:hypothetical protein ATK86_0988 [Nocardia fluminea]|uniref:DUF8176 domain-containing protein n=2 Tax=Nocardia fluminea TaxID=134984 RepID=A0A2N3WYH1_9NOCA|nr:hypothetical protein ATK86_0988 [Nocardia fluminea]